MGLFGKLTSKWAYNTAVNSLNAGVLKPEVLAKSISDNFRKEVYKTIQNAKRKRQILTCEEVIKPADKDLYFWKLCDKVGLSRHYLEGIIENELKATK